MNPKVGLLLERAREDLRVAQELFERAHTGHASSTAYYAMFHAAEALLLSLGIEVSSHSATHAAFGVHFAKTGKLDPALHRSLIQAFNKRIAADYDVAIQLPAEEVEAMLDQAGKFVAAAEELLNAA